MRKLFIIVSLVLFPSLVFAQSAKDAVRALKKLEARCQAGISYKDYSPALGDAKFEVNMFMGTHEAKQKPELASSIQKAMQHYETAAFVWKLKFVGRGVNETLALDDYNRYGHTLIGAYPKMNKPTREGGSLITIEGWQTIPTETKIFISSALSIIWAYASDEIAKTDTLIKEIQSKSRAEQLNIRLVVDNT